MITILGKNVCLHCQLEFLKQNSCMYVCVWKNISCWHFLGSVIRYFCVDHPWLRLVRIHPLRPWCAPHSTPRRKAAYHTVAVKVCFLADELTAKSKAWAHVQLNTFACCVSNSRCQHTCEVTFARVQKAADWSVCKPLHHCTHNVQSHKPWKVRGKSPAVDVCGHSFGRD